MPQGGDRVQPDARRRLHTELVRRGQARGGVQDRYGAAGPGQDRYRRPRCRSVTAQRNTLRDSSLLFFIFM